MTSLKTYCLVPGAPSAAAGLVMVSMLATKQARGKVRDRRADGGRTFDVEQGARHKRLDPGLGTLVEVEDGEPRGVSTDGVCAGSYGSAEGARGERMTDSRLRRG